MEELLLTAAMFVISAMMCVSVPYGTNSPLLNGNTAITDSAAAETSELYAREEEIYRAAVVYNAASAYVNSFRSNTDIKIEDNITTDMIAAKDVSDFTYNFDESYTGYKIFRSSEDKYRIDRVEWESKYYPDGKGVYPANFTKNDLLYSGMPDTVNISPYKVYAAAQDHAAVLYANGEWNENIFITCDDLVNAGFIEGYPQIHYLIATKTENGKPNVKYVEWFTADRGKIRYPQPLDEAAALQEYYAVWDVYKAAAAYADELYNAGKWDAETKITLEALVETGKLTSYPFVNYQINTTIENDRPKIASLTWTSRNGKDYTYLRTSYADTEEYKTAEKIFNAVQSYVTEIDKRGEWESGKWKNGGKMSRTNNFELTEDILNSVGFTEKTDVSYWIVFDGYDVPVPGYFVTYPKVSYIYWSDEYSLTYSYPEKSSPLEGAYSY